MQINANYSVNGVPYDNKRMITSYQEHCKYKAFRSLQTRKNNI